MAAALSVWALLVLVGAGGCGGNQSESTTTAQPTVEVQRLELLSDLALGLVQDLAAGRFGTAESRFDEQMKAALPEAKLREVWATVQSQAGAFQETVATRDERAGEYTIIYVTARFAQADLDIKVVFDGQDRIAGLFFLPATPAGATTGAAWVPPAYADEDAFTEHEVTVGSGQWALPGTLTLPKGKGPFPVVILVHGSGPHDRDETIGPNKPFRDLAWGLAGRQVAVLRYDKRTFAHQAAMAQTEESVTLQEETVDDAVIAALQLAKPPSGWPAHAIDPERIFVLGHSLGGTAAPRIALACPAVAGIIILAGGARPLEEAILDQAKYIARSDGSVTEQEQTALSALERQVQRVKSSSLSVSTSKIELPLSIPAAYWLDLRDYRPAEVAATLPLPMLILQGGRDYQVTETDFSMWKDALGGKSNVVFKEHPALNHLFQEGTGVATPAEYERAGHVSHQVIDDIVRFVGPR